jgi:protein TonB
METLMLQPICLAVFFLDGNSVLMTVAAAAAMIYLYILIAKKIKPEGKKGRMLEKTTISRGIGISAALFFTAVLMSWTSEKTEQQFVETIEEEVIWANEVSETVDIKKELPKANIEPPKLESPKFEIKDIIEKLPDEKKAVTGSPDGKGDEKNKSIGTEIKLPDFEIEDKREKEVEIEMPLTFAEKMPRYCGCEEAGQKEEEKRICSDKKMTAYLAKVVDYPLMAREMGYEGKVFISFTVETDGTLSNIEIKKDMTPGGGMGNAAKKAVEKMAKESCWQAAEQKGRKVRLRLTVPVQFRIRTN